MIKKFFLSISILIIIFLFLIFYVAPNSINKPGGLYWYLKALVPEPIKLFIKENLIKSKMDQIKKEKIEKTLNQKEENKLILNTLKKLKLIDKGNLKSKENKKFEFNKYQVPFSSQILWAGKPSAYIEYFENNVILSSGNAQFLYFDFKELQNKEITFEKLDSNIKDIVKYKEFYEPGNLGIRDLEVIENKIYLTYPKEMGDDCYVMSILKAEINFNFLKFDEFYTYKKCLGTWLSTRSGGRLESMNDYILLSIGDYGLEEYPPSSQDLENFYGKIIKINKLNKNAEIISYGHRNPQGLYYDNELNVILETEHGPNGGDELNLIYNNNKINNYGWPISSYGKHYDGTVKRHKENNTYESLVKGAPLHKSHKKYGFIEPLKDWTPSIGISQVIKVSYKFRKDYLNDYWIAAMGNNIPEGDMTIHHLRFSKDFSEIEFKDKLVVNERIRDLIYIEEKNLILLLLENTPALLVIK
tara:strand:- start:3 stop:1418 length:1416 start_codon:yes stop_codon:yes gene_type:complete